MPAEIIKNFDAPAVSITGREKRIYDCFERPLRDLRISVTDRCNFRCHYCMPARPAASMYRFIPSEQFLSFDEIVRLSKIFIQAGVSKIRLTGGEPLLRPEIPVLVKRLADISTDDKPIDIALTTNGFFLSEHAAALKKAGLARLTVSLDTLDERTFRKITSHDNELKQVLDGIFAAEKAGFRRIKINTVVMRRVNEEGVLALADRFRGTGHVLRFIEYMDAGNCHGWQSRDVVSSKEIFQRIERCFPLEPLEPNYRGEVASRYRYKDGKGEIGFISAITQPFCGDCTRLRLSPAGVLYTCLFAGEGHNLRPRLRCGASDEEILAFVQSVWQKRADKYSEHRSLFSSFPNRFKKIEMFQIGG